MGEAEVSVVRSTQDPVLPSPTSLSPSTTTKILRRSQPQTTKVTRRPQQSTVTSEKSTTFIPITETTPSSEKLKSKVTTFYPPGKNIKDVKNAEAVTTDPNQKVDSERDFLPRWSR